MFDDDREHTNPHADCAEFKFSTQTENERSSILSLKPQNFFSNEALHLKLANLWSAEVIDKGSYRDYMVGSATLAVK